jgi:glycosyltransferase involved in cell wall biosynthesis
LPFRERTRVESVVYLDGWGGVHERKGWPEVRELLRLSPGLVRVKSQRGLPGAEPAADVPAALYADADAVLVPGRFDGLGLTALEALASGCVVLATDSEPYREFVGGAYGAEARRCLLPVDGAAARDVPVWGNPWPCRPANVGGMLAVVESAKWAAPAGVRGLSRAGRAYALRAHGAAAWDALRDAVRGGGADAARAQGR